MQNAVFKRGSGHNTITVSPSTWDFKFARNWIHFYALLIGIPLSVVSTIINIRANPELTEVPEGYEPLPWEYQKHPVQRFMCKHFYYPLEREHEAWLGFQEYKAEHKILRNLAKKIDTVMKFYNDHRSRNFTPGLGGDYIRTGRDEWAYFPNFMISMTGEHYDDAFDPERPVIPTEGYKDGPID